MFTKINYCCFNSKLARIFQEQGKAQLAISFGTAQYANCGIYSRRAAKNRFF
ncbi:type-1V conjugative transfer system mating pair stabilization family protein [Rickettsia hoogstraalii str. RCCE3]|nr:type-1V conjugative transfer system mating pair stabilization family protein [Rickettsia hoogstraalii str. RCCE3]